jgi:hypothetical protein
MSTGSTLTRALWLADGQSGRIRRGAALEEHHHRTPQGWNARYEIVRATRGRSCA